MKASQGLSHICSKSFTFHTSHVLCASFPFRLWKRVEGHGLERPRWRKHRLQDSDVTRVLRGSVGAKVQRIMRGSGDMRASQCKDRTTPRFRSLPSLAGLVESPGSCFGLLNSLKATIKRLPRASNMTSKQLRCKCSKVFTISTCHAHNSSPSVGDYMSHYISIKLHHMTVAVQAMASASAILE